jgi:hypothetical protein
MLFQRAQGMKGKEHPTRIQNGSGNSSLEQACHLHFNNVNLDNYLQSDIRKKF